jgi:membrane protease YdiL (CAAX protease family)
MNNSSTPCRTSVHDEIRRAITNAAAPHHEPPSVVRRRRIVVGIVVVIGVVVLGLSMTRQPGELSFYWMTLVLAAVWMVGALFSGPLHLGGICWRGRNQRPVITGTTIGLLLGGIFVLGGLVVRGIPGLCDLVTRVLHFASHGSLLLIVLITVVSAIAEEMFYRGALYTALGRHHPVIMSTIVYVGATMASGNVILGFAAIILGAVCALERRASGGVLAPMLTHSMWGLITVLALPPLFGV